MDQRRRHRQLIDATTVLEARFGRLGGGFGTMLEAWRVAVGPAMARFTMPTSVSGGELRVRCADASWTSEVLHQSPEILVRLRAQLGHRAPDRIKPTTGRIPDTAAANPTPTPPQLQPLPSRDAAAIRAVVEGLPAGDVRASVERAMQRARQAQHRPR